MSFLFFLWGRFCNKDEEVQAFFNIIKWEPQKLPNGPLKMAN